MIAANHSAARRVSAGLGLLAIVGGSLGAVLHEVEERHAICAEHGERIHLEVASDAPSQALPPGSVVTKSKASGDHGDHCASAYMINAPLASASTVVTQIGAPPASLSLPCRATSALACVYRLAPKTSPPA